MLNLLKQKRNWLGSESHYMYEFSLFIGSAKKKKKGSKKSSGFDNDVIIGTAIIKITVSLLCTCVCTDLHNYIYSLLCEVYLFIC